MGACRPMLLLPTPLDVGVGRMLLLLLLPPSRLLLLLPLLLPLPWLVLRMRSMSEVAMGASWSSGYPAVMQRDKLQGRAGWVGGRG